MRSIRCVLLLLMLPLAVQAAEDRVVARVGTTTIPFSEVHCDGPRCLGDDQHRLEARVFALVLDPALRRAGLAVSENDVKARLARELPPAEAIEKVVAAHRAVADAALAVYGGERVEAAYARLLQPRNLSIDLLHQFLKTNGTAERAREFLARDLGRDLRDDIERQVRLDIRSEMLAEHLASLSGAARECFWKKVFAESAVVIVDPAFRIPDMKRVFTRHEMQPVSLR